MNYDGQVATTEDGLLKCCKAGCQKHATVDMDSGTGIYPFCDDHGNEAAIEHDYTFVQRLSL